MTMDWRSGVGGVMLTALLAAGGAAMSTGPAHAQEVAEITMWDVPESEPYTNWWRAHIDAFNAAHPDIKVTLEVFETEAYRPKIASALAAGTPADIF